MLNKCRIDEDPTTVNLTEIPQLLLMTTMVENQGWTIRTVKQLSRLIRKQIQLTQEESEG
jgi:hypothetical protein